MDRRKFVLASAAVSALSTTATAAEEKDDEKTPVRVGVMGLSRGRALASDLASISGVEVAYACDVDAQRASACARDVERKTGTSPEVTADFRQILDDPRIDALVCAAPNHWHGPATIMACKAGKHVYVEKPCSHNPQEGEWMVAAAERFGRCVQMGTQRRSAAGTQTAIEKLHSGAIGQVHLARCYYNNLRGPIPHAKSEQPPATLNYELWEGPAPHQPYRSNVVHYNWHWFWHWGGGELANNGVHGLDLCRWGLDVQYPLRTTSSGGRYWHDDAQETPDTQSVCYEFAGNKQITWDALSCNKHRVSFFCAFYGDEGTLELDSDGQFRIYNRNNELSEEGEQSSGGQIEHLRNFIDAIRADDPSRLNQPILEGHRSTLLCHLGNIAHRTGTTVHTDENNGHLLPGVHTQEQQRLWQREYAPAWKADVTLS